MALSEAEKIGIGLGVVAVVIIIVVIVVCVVMMRKKKKLGRKMRGRQLEYGRSPYITPPAFIQDTYQPPPLPIQQTIIQDTYRPSPFPIQQTYQEPQIMIQDSYPPPQFIPQQSFPSTPVLFQDSYPSYPTLPVNYVSTPNLVAENYQTPAYTIPVDMPVGQMSYPSPLPTLPALQYTSPTWPSTPMITNATVPYVEPSASIMVGTPPQYSVQYRDPVGAQEPVVYNNYTLPAAQLDAFLNRKINVVPVYDTNRSTIGVAPLKIEPIKIEPIKVKPIKNVPFKTIAEINQDIEWRNAKIKADTDRRHAKIKADTDRRHAKINAEIEKLNAKTGWDTQWAKTEADFEKFKQGFIRDWDRQWVQTQAVFNEGFILPDPPPPVVVPEPDWEAVRIQAIKDFQRADPENFPLPHYPNRTGTTVQAQPVQVGSVQPVQVGSVQPVQVGSLVTSPLYNPDAADESVYYFYAFQDQ